MTPSPDPWEVLTNGIAPCDYAGAGLGCAGANATIIIAEPKDKTPEVNDG